MPEQHRRDILAEVTFLATAEGGRATPALTGYRPQLWYDDVGWSAMHEYIDVPSVAPGQTARAFLTFMSPERHIGKLSAGQPFLLREGSRVIGTGKMIEILNPELKADNTTAS
ncbi:MAG: elongation factor Tu [Chloroflexota bacterium]|nr:elongation factor Tu [Chloroflexota bacterium]